MLTKTLNILLVISGMLSSNAFAGRLLLTKSYKNIEAALVAPNKTSTTAAKVAYYGGPVIGHAKVVLVFWGSNVSSKTKSVMPDYYASVVDSTYMDWLSIYNTDVKSVDGRDGTHQQIGRGSYLQAVEINPSITSGKLDDTQIQAELDKNIEAGVLPKPDADTLYMIHFPPKLTITIGDPETGQVMTSCQQFCAYHEGFVSKKFGNIYYGVMPDQSSFACSFGCGGGDGLFTASSHELIEAITDPFPTPGTHPKYPQAWNTAEGSEVGDLCQSSKGSLQGKNGTTYIVQQEWSNTLNGCTTGDYRH